MTTSGNASAQSIGTAGEVTFRPPAWVLEAKSAFVRNKAEGVVNAKSLTALGRAGRVLTPRLQAFAQHGYLRDLFSGVEHRNTTEGGLSYVAFDSGRQLLRADFGLGYLNERRTLGATLSTPTAGTGGRYRFRFSESSDLTEDALFSFDLSNQGTWRLHQTLALTAKVVELLSLKISNDVRYVDEPVPGFEQTDTITSAALVLNF